MTRSELGFSLQDAADSEIMDRRKDSNLLALLYDRPRKSETWIFRVALEGLNPHHAVVLLESEAKEWLLIDSRSSAFMLERA